MSRPACGGQAKAATYKANAGNRFTELSRD